MKLPARKQKELKEKGKPDSPEKAGGGAMGRLRQFQQERGLVKAGLSNPATEGSSKDKPKKKRASKK